MTLIESSLFCLSTGGYNSFSNATVSSLDVNGSPKMVGGSGEIYWILLTKVP